MDNSSVSDSPQKKASKGILKKPKTEGRQKCFQWDEMNILATYHPADKTYGHMKIDEPKTPYVFESEDGKSNPPGTSFTPEDLAARLAAACDGSEENMRPSSSVDVELLDPKEAEHQRKFREKRRAHYNEFLAVKMSKERLKNDDNDEDDEDPEHDLAAEQAAMNARYNATVAKTVPIPDEYYAHDKNESPSNPRDLSHRKPRS